MSLTDIFSDNSSIVRSVRLFSPTAAILVQRSLCSVYFNIEDAALRKVPSILFSINQQIERNS